MPTSAALYRGPSCLPERSSASDTATDAVRLEAEVYSAWQDEADDFNEAISRILLGEHAAG